MEPSIHVPCHLKCLLIQQIRLDIQISSKQIVFSSKQTCKHCLACIMKLRQAKNQVFTTIWGQLIFNKTAGHDTQCQGFWLEIFRLRTAKKLCTWAAAAERVPGQPQLLAICGIALSAMLKDAKRTNPRNLSNTMSSLMKTGISFFYVKNCCSLSICQVTNAAP